MRMVRLLRWLLIGLFALGLLGAWVKPAVAGSLAKVKIPFAVEIGLDPLDPVVMGNSITLAGVIKDQYGKPVANKSVQFAVDGIYLGQTPSDEFGRFERTFKEDLVAGTHEVTAFSTASHLLQAGTATMSLEIKPAVVLVQTIPAIEGVAFKMDGREFLTNPAGLASIEISRPGRYRLYVLAEEYENPNQKVEFGRWSEEIFEPYRDIQVPYTDVIQVGLNVYHYLGQHFVDLDGEPVDTQRISEFSVRSLQGDAFTWTDQQFRWIPASRVARRITGLEVTPLYYSVTSVMIDGSNVVNQSQQRFYSSPGGVWEISLILYSLQVNAQDGFFGFPVGKAITMEYPDGKVVEFPLDDSGKVSIPLLARGTYYIQVTGVSGMSNRIPVALSRNQDVSIKIITALDMAVAGGLALLLALGLLVYGRPWLWRAVVKKASSTSEEVETLPLSAALMPLESAADSSLIPLKQGLAGELHEK